MVNLNSTANGAEIEIDCGKLKLIVTALEMYTGTGNQNDTVRSSWSKEFDNCIAGSIDEDVVSYNLSPQLFDVVEIIAHVVTIFCPNVGWLAGQMIVVAFVPAANFVKRIKNL
jgi:hypothetical protein